MTSENISLKEGLHKEGFQKEGLQREGLQKEGLQKDGLGKDKMPSNLENPQEHNLTVALRIRPMNDDEIISGASPVAYALENNMVILLDPCEDPDDVLRAHRSREKQFVFDIAFEGGSTQKEVYEGSTKQLIPTVLSGYNATVFAYGATGAGKTYTMLGTDDEPGIMARAINDLFQEMSRTSEEMAYKVTMSYLEIYNEMIRDLLNPSAGFLDLREDNKGVQVAGLTELSAQSTKEVMDILSQGNKERTQEPTAANQTSSRSHAVLQISVLGRQRVRTSTRQMAQIGRLFMIDLAGSERAANTQNRGKRMQEGAHINRSLLALGNCINALCDKNGARYINFRDSKLTRLLKDALGGNCQTVMIAHVSPASVHFEESRNTLVYADRAKNIKTKVRRNVMDVSYHIAQYSSIISELREEIKRLRVKLDRRGSRVKSSSKSSNNDSEDVQKLKKMLLNNFQRQMELRRHLLELNSTNMEMTLDMTRHKLLMRKWDREKALVPRHTRLVETDIDEDIGSNSDDVVFLTENKDKQCELSGEEVTVPEEVSTAREQLVELTSELHHMEQQREHIAKELNIARQEGRELEQQLPQLVSRGEQLEILLLLCQVHELELDNMEAQSAWLQQSFTIKEKDLALKSYDRHRLLCDDIIQQQKSALDNAGVPITKELDELYELYLQESADMLVDKAHFLPPIEQPKLTTSVLQCSQLGSRWPYADSLVSLHTDLSSQRQTSILSNGDFHLPALVAPATGYLVPASSRRSIQRRNTAQGEDTVLFARHPTTPQTNRDYLSELRTLQGTKSLGHLTPPAESSYREEEYNDRMDTRGYNRRRTSIMTLDTSTSDGPTSIGWPASGQMENIILPPFDDSNGFDNLPQKEREMMLMGTRGIAAVAAVRKKHYNGSSSDINSVNRRVYHKHSEEDRKDAMNLQNQLIRSQLVQEYQVREDGGGETALTHHYGKPRVRKPYVRKLAPPWNVNTNGSSSSSISYQQLTPEDFFRKLAKKNPHHLPAGRPIQTADNSPDRKPFVPPFRKAWVSEKDVTDVENNNLTNGYMETSIPPNSPRRQAFRSVLVKKSRTAQKSPIQENTSLLGVSNIPVRIPQRGPPSSHHHTGGKLPKNKPYRKKEVVAQQPTLSTFLRADLGVSGNGYNVQ